MNKMLRLTTFILLAGVIIFTAYFFIKPNHADNLLFKMSGLLGSVSDFSSALVIKAARSDTDIPGPSVSPRGMDTSIATLKDGTMVMLRAANNYDQDGKKYTSVFMLTSDNNGNTWTDKGPIVSHIKTKSTSYALNNPHVSVLKDGSLIGAYRLWTNEPDQQTHSIEVIKSTDNGKTWDKISTAAAITLPKNPVLATGIWEPFIIEPTKKPGVMQMYYAQERDHADVCTSDARNVKKGQDLMMRESRDGGKTWGTAKVIARNGQSREGIPTVAELRDGSLVVAHEHLRYPDCYDNTPQSGLVPSIMMSNDGGDTWVDYGPAFLPEDDEIRSGWVHMTLLEDGRLALRFSKQIKKSTTGERKVMVLVSTNRPTFENPPEWEDAPIQAMDGDFLWGTIAQAPNGNIIVTGAREQEQQKYRVVPKRKFAIERAAKPNVVFIMLDDAGYGDFTHPDVIKPSIERLAQESMRFEQFYTNPMCTPTRMTMLSGEYAMKYGISWVCGAKAVYGIPGTDPTLPQTLKSSGYVTGSFGKWHTGTGRSDYEISDKFDFWAQSQGVVGNGYFNTEYDSNVPKPNFEGHVHATYRTAEYVLDYIKRYKDTKPFFVNYWLNAPHSPHTPNLYWANRYLQKERGFTLTAAEYFKDGFEVRKQWKNAEYRPVFYRALFSQADANIGRVLAEIDNDPYLYQNTIVMLTSDNGGTELAHPNGNTDTKVTLRGFKTDVFEGGTRLPLYVRWPGMVEPGVVNQSIVSAEDIFPTVVELTGGRAPGQIAGNSFAKAALNNIEITRSEPLFRAHKVRNEHLGDGDSILGLDLMSYSVRDGKWKLVYEPLDRDTAYLFDMTEGISEDPAKDRSTTNVKKFNALQAKYLNWLFTTSAINLQVANLKGNVEATNANKSFTFAKQEKVGGQVEFANQAAFNVTRLDTTFVAQVTPTGGMKSERVIARRQGSWQLAITEDNRLKLTIFAQQGENKTVFSKTVLQKNVKYNVAFTLYGFKESDTVLSLYVAEADNGTDTLKREKHVAVPFLKDNDNTVYLGSGKDTKYFVGVIENVKMYRAPLTKDQILEVISRF